MNNLVFNTVASELKTSIYAQSPDQSIKALQLDENNNLKVTMTGGTVSLSGAITIANEILTVYVDNPITIANEVLTITGDVEVTNPITIANAITITNESLTINGSITISGITDGSLTVNLSDPITIANEILTVYVDNSITIANEVLTITGDIEVTNPITIANQTLTVLGNVTVSNPVTVANAITIANQTLSVNITGHDVSTLSYIQTLPVGTGNIFENTNISQIKVGTIFVYNDSATPFTLSLQMSPTTNSADYIDDPSYSLMAILGNSKKLITISRYALYFRLAYSNLVAAQVRIWYNGQK